jgi:hypothetical protein
MSAFNNYLRISSFLESYLCKEMLLDVPYPLPSQDQSGYSASTLVKHAFFKDVIYECSSEEVTKMFCRTLNIRELAFIAERIEGYLIENGY